jgi:hypothetical protein
MTDDLRGAIPIQSGKNEADLLIKALFGGFGVSKPRLDKDWVIER